jgi:ribonuclease HI
MNIPAPHFLLFSEAQGKNRQGQWRFVLQAADGSATFEVADSEPGTTGERLELLAVVRGLEALDQPSQVTLFTPSKYVNRGIAYGIDDWRTNDWTWERFGEFVPVKNCDLWQRVDHALAFHRIEFRGWRFDTAHSPQRGATRSGNRQNSERPHELVHETAVRSGIRQNSERPLANRSSLEFRFDELAADVADHLTVEVAKVAVAKRRRARGRHGLAWAAARLRRGAEARFEAWKLSCSQLGTCFLPKPWIK